MAAGAKPRVGRTKRSPAGGGASGEARAATVAGAGPAAPAAEVLVRDAHRAAGAIADETIAFMDGLHPGLLAGSSPEFEEVLRSAIHHSSLRWICGVADWWARKAQAGPGEDV